MVEMDLKTRWRKNENLELYQVLTAVQTLMTRQRNSMKTINIQSYLM